MLYALPNGQEIDLTKVKGISKVRDYGRDSNSIDLHLIGFSIQMQKEVVDITDSYHFCDWAEVTKKLKLIREEILSKWEQLQSK